MTNNKEMPAAKNKVLQRHRLSCLNNTAIRKWDRKLFKWILNKTPQRIDNKLKIIQRRGGLCLITLKKNESPLCLGWLCQWKMILIKMGTQINCKIKNPKFLDYKGKIRKRYMPRVIMKAPAKDVLGNTLKTHRTPGQFLMLHKCFQRWGYLSTTTTKTVRGNRWERARLLPRLISWCVLSECKSPQPPLPKGEEPEGARKAPHAWTASRNNKRIPNLKQLRRKSASPINTAIAVTSRN